MADRGGAVVCTGLHSQLGSSFLAVGGGGVLVAVLRW